MTVDYQIIKRYLEGQEKEGDKELILEWFSDQKAEKDLKAKYKQFWSELPCKREANGYKSTIVLDRIHQIIKSEGASQLRTKRGISRVVNLISIWPRLKIKLWERY